MQCIKNGCLVELSGRQKTYCSDKCRMSQSRTEVETKPEQTKVEQKVEQDFLNHSVHLAYYLSHLEEYVSRLEPERMNWGAPMTEHDLEHSGFKCNRVPIPGDWDYAGVAKTDLR